MAIIMKEILIWKHNNNSYKRVLRKISDQQQKRTDKHRATENQPKKKNKSE